MTQEEAYRILAISHDEDIFDVWELAVFELKKDVLSKPFLRKPLEAKKCKLQKLAELAEFLELSKGEMEFDLHLIRLETKSPYDLWKAYFSDRNQLRHFFSITENPAKLVELCEEALQLEAHYCNQFPNLNWTEDQPVFGVEPDPMPIQQELLQWHEKGFQTFEALEQIKNQCSNALLLGLKRLSLLPKYL